MNAWRQPWRLDTWAQPCRTNQVVFMLHASQTATLTLKDQVLNFSNELPCPSLPLWIQFQSELFWSTEIHLFWLQFVKFHVYLKNSYFRMLKKDYSDTILDVPRRAKYLTILRVYISSTQIKWCLNKVVLFVDWFSSNIGLNCLMVTKKY